MKKSFSFILAVCLLLGCLSIAGADSINLTKIKARETFSYNDSKNTDWTYYQYAEKTAADGTYVEILVADWGNNTEASGYPEFRIFASTKANEDIIVQGATFMIDGNMFELTLDELKLDKSHGALFYLTSDAIPFMKSLAAAHSVSAILRYNGGTVSVAFTESEIAPIGQFVHDLLDIDFLHHIVNTESDYENWYKEKTPIMSYVFNEVVFDEQPESIQPAVQTSDDGWCEYPLNGIGLTVSLPAEYMAFTRGMSASDPVLIEFGFSPEELDQILVDGNYYLEASPDYFDSEVMVTMVGSTVNDFADWNDSVLLSMSSLWISSYADYGLEILDTDIFSCNGIKFIRMYQRQTGEDSVAYRVQYYTTTNNQAINLVFVSANDEVTETEKAFMQEFVERAVFNANAPSSDIGAFAQDISNFTYTILEDGTAAITGYNGLAGTLAIPSVIDGHSVSSLAVLEKNGLVANIFIPETVLATDGNPFVNWQSLKTITVPDDHPCFATKDGILYSSDQTTLISYPAKHVGEDFSIPVNITRIGKEAFYGAGALTRLSLPEGLLEICDNAFFGLDSVPIISIPSTVEMIGANPFYGMYKLEEINVASSNKTFTVQQGALYNRKTNTLIAFPRKYVTSSFAFRDGITSIGDYAFWSNGNSLNIVLPSTLTYIGNSAFCGCENMTFSDLPAGVKTIGDSAFMSAKISRVTLPASIMSIGRACFATTSLTEVIIMPGITEIAPVMFNNCRMTKVFLPETVKKIGDMAFVNCKNLTELNIPSSVLYIGDDVFKNCPAVKVSVVEGSLGETYCKQHGISYQYYTPDASTRGSLREFTLVTGPMSVVLDESKYNVLVPGMDTTEPAVIRSGIRPDGFETYMSLGNKALMMFDINDDITRKFDISIRIKDHQYEGVDLRKCYSWEATEALNLIYSSFESTASNKEILKINGVPYLKFSWMNGTQLRYATIINGDMIYIWATREDDEVTAEDAELLLQVVEAVKYLN